MISYTVIKKYPTKNAVVMSPVPPENHSGSPERAGDEQPHFTWWFLT